MAFHVPHTSKLLSLEGEHQILSDSWVVIASRDRKEPFIVKLSADVAYRTVAAYLITGKVTEITLPEGKAWIADNESFATIRGTTVYAGSEQLALAEAPINDSVRGGVNENKKENEIIALDGLYEDLKSGAWVIVSGERELSGTTGVRYSELAMLSTVLHDAKGDAGEGIRTYIALAKPLAFAFKRDTVKIHGNVVKATHGEARMEIMGSGDGAKAMQSFTLRQPPLTFVSANTVSGTDSTLKIYVNDVRWSEAPTLSGLGPTDRNFVTKHDDEGKTTVVFGNGREGARLPTGRENLRAEYRNGIGKGGNVKAEKISLLSSRPLGIKDVINPLQASGGADRESREQMRKNVPLAVKALDRLVSVQDYEDFTRTYAGIGKAHAVEVSNGKSQRVYVTVAGVDDIPIEKDSDLYRNLRQSFLDYGDPFQPVILEARELILVVISAGIRILPEYRWESVVKSVTARLLATFSFEQRELGQDVLLSEVISVMQGVPGVQYVDVDAFGGIPEKIWNEKVRRRLTPEEVSKRVLEIVNEGAPKGPAHRIPVRLTEDEVKSLRPAQLAYLTPEVPETLILNQII